ncbi:MAG: AAA family ATPase [Methanoregula sp.]|nr:AAA family ATPase [Methanoregula sp.]
MPVQHIYVENFKSFSRLDLGLSGFHVVIGSNAAGKSNFISIFRFLRDIAQSGIINAIAMQGGTEYLQNTQIGPSRDLRIKVEYVPDQNAEVCNSQGKDDISQLSLHSLISSYEFAIRFDPRGNDFVITKDTLTIGFEVTAGECNGLLHGQKSKGGRGEITVTNEGGELIYSVNLPKDCPISEKEIIPGNFCIKRLPEKTLLLETPYAYSLPHLEKFFDRIAVYDIDPKLLKKGLTITGKRDLDEDAGNLAVVLKNITGDSEKKRKFLNLLRDILPFVEDFSVEKFMDISLVLTLRERYARNRVFPAPSLSDGTMTIFALIIAIYFEDKPFVIFEEPVTHIHPFLVARVIAMLKEGSKNRQVLVTTHSTEVVKHVKIEDLLLISRDTEGFSVVSRPADKREVRTFLENEIGIEELYVQNLLGL